MDSHKGATSGRFSKRSEILRTAHPGRRKLILNLEIIEIAEAPSEPEIGSSKFQFRPFCCYLYSWCISNSSRNKQLLIH